MEGNPPTTQAMGIDQRTHFAGKLRLRQCFDDNIAFPRAVAFGLPVLYCAAPADSKMLAKWRDPFGACVNDLQQAPAIGMMTRHRGNLDRLAAKRVRHIHRLSVNIGGAVAAMSDMIDGKTLNHGARR